MLEKGNECVIIFVLQENFSAMTRLDQNRAAGQIAEKVNSLFCLKNVSSNLAIDFFGKSYHLCSCFSSECLFLL